MPHEAIQLTVAIPTYGRPTELRRCVELLRDQTDHRFNLLILDNASPVPASEALNTVLQGFPAANVTIVRNRFNIGGDANILRCFEFCETDYLWILGTDTPLADSVATILATIDVTPDGIFFNFACELFDRTDKSKWRGLNEFIRSVDSYSNILFLSTSVYRSKDLVTVPTAHQYTYSMAAHLVLLLMALRSKPAICLLLKKRIVRWETPPGGIAWSGVRQFLGLGLLLDLPMSEDNRIRIANLVTSPRAFSTLQSSCLPI